MRKNRLIDDGYFWRNVSGYSLCIGLFIIIIIELIHFKPIPGLIISSVGLLSLICFVIAEIFVFKIKN